MKLLSQKELAERSGHSPSMIHYIVNGDREPSKAMAYDLMIATSVAACSWFFPEVFFNPYIPHEDAVVEGRLWLPPVRSMEGWLKARVEQLAKCDS